MTKGRGVPAQPEKVISIIGPGMHVKGDCETGDTVRIEGVVEGSVVAKKAVVVGRKGRVIGDITTADAKIAGAVTGKLEIQSRLELAATCVIDGEINAARLQLEDGGKVNGSLHVGQQTAEPNMGAQTSGSETARNAQPPRPSAARRRLARK